ncbi:uncharacterized protein LOC134217034 [Armigeres subalbatus]|uniref:uncharacterized protein LOC134217034 n=1 Tax=Armigeres subalbatus TaxID=124917 RepID=UPI002ED305DE
MRATVAVLVICCFSVSWAVVTVTFDGEFLHCDNDMEPISLDVSKFDILMLDNENITLDGKLLFVKDFNNPTSVKVNLERKSNGLWIPTAARWIPNICEVIGHPGEKWNTVIAAFSQQECPFQSGHEEIFEKANVGNMAKNMKLPPTMLGYWRMFVEVRTKRDGKLETECTKVIFLLEDV